MAKSLRASTKQKNKVLKRQGVFGNAAAEREKAVAERLHNAAIDQILANQEQPAAKVNDSDSMQVESAPPAASTKKSTGGWGRKRNSRGKKSRKSRK